MSRAKSLFLERLKSIDNALNSTEVAPLGLNHVEHNEKTKILRNGLAIIEFNVIEDFIKRRLGEVFKEIRNSGIAFNNLPSELIETSVLHSLKGIISRAEHLKRAQEDHISFLQTETGFISSTSGTNYDLSEYSLGWDKSNLSQNDIYNFFKPFKIKGGWDSIKQISSMVGVTLISPKEVFNNAAQRRHKAAHNPNADSPLNDLKDFVHEAKIIALSIDVLLSKSLEYIYDGNQNFLQGTLKVETTSLKFRTLKYKENKWKEFVDNNTRAYRTNTDFETIFNASKVRARRNKQVLVIKPRENEIKDWIIP